MLQGIQFFDSSGRVTMDTTSIVGLLIGSIQVAVNEMSGSVISDKLLNGTPFAVAFCNFSNYRVDGNSGTTTAISLSQIKVELSGNRLSWSRPVRAFSEDKSPAGVIYYGVY